MGYNYVRATFAIQNHVIDSRDTMMSLGPVRNNAAIANRRSLKIHDTHWNHYYDELLEIRSVLVFAPK